MILLSPSRDVAETIRQHIIDERDQGIGQDGLRAADGLGTENREGSPIQRRKPDRIRKHRA